MDVVWGTTGGEAGGAGDVTNAGGAGETATEGEGCLALLAAKRTGSRGNVGLGGRDLIGLDSRLGVSGLRGGVGNLCLTNKGSCLGRETTLF